MKIQNGRKFLRNLNSKRNDNIVKCTKIIIVHKYTFCPSVYTTLGFWLGMKTAVNAIIKDAAA